MTDAEVLERAVEVARERPHVKNRLTDPATGGVCIRGAVLTARFGFGAANTSSWNDPQYVRIDHLIQRKVLDGQNPAVWNNRLDTTRADVIAALERAHEHALRG